MEINNYLNKVYTFSLLSLLKTGITDISQKALGKNVQEIKKKKS